MPLRNQDVRRRVAEYFLKFENDTIKPTNIYHALNIPPSSTGSILTEFLKKGWIYRVQPGFYTVTPTGREEMRVMDLVEQRLPRRQPKPKPKTKPTKQPMKTTKPTQTYLEEKKEDDGFTVSQIFRLVGKTKDGIPIVVSENGFLYGMQAL